MLRKPRNKKDIPYPMPIAGKPIKPGKPIKGKPIRPGKDKPFPMPGPIDDMMFPNPGMSKYSPIKKTKQVNKIYKTY